MSIRPVESGSSRRLPGFLILVLFVAFLAGRFSLDRLGIPLSLDLRWLFLGILGVGVLILRTHPGQRELPLALGQGQLFTLFAVLAWLTWMALSAFWAPVNSRIVDGLFDLLIMGLLILAAYAIFQMASARELDQLWIWALLAGLVYFALAMWSGADAQGRYSAPGGGPNTFVRVMVLAAIAALRLGEGRRWILGAIPLFGLGALLSGSRGGLLAAAVVLALFLVRWLKQTGLRVAALVVLILILGVALVLWRDNGEVVTFLSERFIEQTLEAGYASGRDTISSEVVQLWTRQPVIGAGLDGYFGSQVTPSFEYPHNLALATLAEGGLVGLGLLVAAMTFPVLVAAWSRRSDVMFASMVWVFFFGASLFSGDYYDSRFVWFFGALGLAYYAKSVPVERPTNG